MSNTDRHRKQPPIALSTRGRREDARLRLARSLRELFRRDARLESDRRFGLRLVATLGLLNANRRAPAPAFRRRQSFLKPRYRRRGSRLRRREESPSVTVEEFSTRRFQITHRQAALASFARHARNLFR